MSLETDALEALTHDPTKVLKGVVSLLRWLSTRNDAKALAEFREAMDDQVVLNAQGIEKLAATNEQRLEQMERMVDRLVGMVVRPEDWKDQPEHEKPTEADVVTRAAQFARATLKAGSHGKRRILWNAFFSSFKPDFYREGWSNHLWNIAEQIEYPECRWLAEHVGEQSLPAIDSTGADYFLVRRLESHGLARTFSHSRTQSNATPSVTEVGHRFKLFVWDDDMWRDEKPQG